MLTQQARNKLAEQRKAVFQWLCDGATQPLVLPRNNDYMPSRVLWPGIWQKIRQNLRSLLVFIAGKMLWSPCKIAIYRLLGMKVGRGVYIAPGVMIDPLYPELISLHDHCILGMGCRLLTHEITAGNFRLGRITVEEGAVVGGYSLVRSGVTIGQKATVGCSSFVNSDVPAGKTVGGVPARVLSARQETE